MPGLRRSVGQVRGVAAQHGKAVLARGFGHGKGMLLSMCLPLPSPRASFDFFCTAKARMMPLLLFWLFAFSSPANAQTSDSMTMTAGDTTTMVAPPPSGQALYGYYHWIDCSGGADIGVWGVCVEGRFLDDTMTIIMTATSILALAWLINRSRKV